MASQKYLGVLKSVPVQDRPPAQQPKQDTYAAFTAWQEKFGANFGDLGGKLRPDGKIVRYRRNRWALRGGEGGDRGL